MSEEGSVSALFASRKGKKGKKKKFKSFCANKMVQKMEDTGDELDREGVLRGGENLETGDWVEETEDGRKQGVVLLSKQVGDLQVGQEKVEEDVGDEQSKLEFHMARAKAQREADKPAGKPVPEEKKPVPQEDSGPKVWKPRFLSRMPLKKASGRVGIKDLKDESAFPSLGGSATTTTTTSATPSAPTPTPTGASASASAWGKVSQTVLDEVEKAEAVPEPKYLGATFIPSAAFDGAKPGYSFSVGDSGLGYYWQGTEMEGEGGEGEKGKEEEQAEGEKETTEEVFDERFKPSVTAWRPKRREGSGVSPPPPPEEETEAALTAVTATATATVAPVAPVAQKQEDKQEDRTGEEAEEEVEEDRFALLKKKKKKKKKKTEE